MATDICHRVDIDTCAEATGATLDAGLSVRARRMREDRRVDLPVMPPVKPMLARPAPDMPAGMLYEPKWDGFRALVFRDGDEIEITSRNTKPMTRYFPELVEVLRTALPARCVLDGEIVVIGPDGLDFEELAQRVHPAASRVAKLARETPVSFVAFDLLALGDEALANEPFTRRRAALEQVLAGDTGASAGTGPDTRVDGVASGRMPAGVYLTPATDDLDRARDWFERFEGAGLDGLVAKPPAGVYQPDKRAMFKIKHDRTADCVVAGYRPHKNDPNAVGSLLLGLYADPRDSAPGAGVTDPGGAEAAERRDVPLLAVGVTSAFPMARRRELVRELAGLVTSIDDHPWARPDAAAPGAAAPGPVDGAGAEPVTRTPWDAGESRWSRGRDLSFVPLRPELVVEVRYDHMEGPRFRHTTQFVRFRPDRDPRSCTYAQLERPVRFALADVLGLPPG